MELENKIVKWISDYTDKSQLDSYIVGVSGGIDSAVTSMLCALTGKRTIIISLPINQNKSHLIRAQNHIENLINGESIEDVLNRLLPYYENDIAYTFKENSFPLIVAHKHSIRVLMKHLLKMSDEEFVKFKLPSETMILVCLDDDMNYNCHFNIKY